MPTPRFDRSPWHGWMALAVLAWGLSCHPAWAEKADRLAPMNVEADALRYDDARQLSVFTGRVVVTKGSIVIRGHQLEVRQDAQGQTFGVVTGQDGQRAFFRQKREGVDEFIEGEAQRIDYDGAADTVKFTGQAVLRRYKGATLNDQTTGAVIVYDNRTEVFTVDGGPASRSADNPSGRVRALLTPRAATDNAPPGPATPLRPSQRLEPAR